MADIRKIEERIQKLWAMAVGDSAEARLARLKATTLAETHRVDLAAVTGRPRDSRVEVVQYKMANRSLWRADLAWAVARYANVRVIRQHDGQGVSVVGMREDFELWRSLFARAEGEIEEEAVAFVACVEGGRGVKRTEGDTFRKAAAAGFGDRLKRHRRESEQSEHGKVTASLVNEAPTAECTALVLSGRKSAVDTKVEQLFPHLRSVRAKSTGSRDAREAGRRFGQGMGVHRGNLQ